MSGQRIDLQLFDERCLPASVHKVNNNFVNALSPPESSAMNGPLYISQSCSFWSERKVRFVARTWQVDIYCLSSFWSDVVLYSRQAVSRKLNRELAHLQLERRCA